jgi:hypothetical protein
MSLARQIATARLNLGFERAHIEAQMDALKACDLAVSALMRLDREILLYANAGAVAGFPAPTVPLLRRIAQYAIDAHCVARAAARIPSEVSAYDRDDLEKYLNRDERPLAELRILASRLLPSEALTLLLSLLPPENA